MLSCAMPVKEAVVRARVDEKLKKDAENILRQPGLSQTEAAHDNDDLVLPRFNRQAGIDSLQSNSPFHSFA